MTETTLFVYKYQPQYFDQFVQNTAIDTLQTLMSIDDLNVLLVGDLTTGKTTMLHALLREYYKDATTSSTSSYHDNVLFVNNLREQGINYYRTDVKTFCQTASTVRGRKKFVVLDDIDFINEQSQQVFRNCIDKYSHNVNFVASCTNVQRVIESLQSRLNVIKIQPLSRDRFVEIANYIARQETIDIDDDARDFIINISNNTVKILMNYMEKCKLLNMKITYDVAVELCSNISFLTFDEYTDHVLAGRLLPAIQLIYELYDKGYSVMDILDNYFTFVKINGRLTECQKYNIIPIICKYITVFHNIHEDKIETALFTNNLIDALVVVA